jgi:hypothetical protein
VILYWCKTYSLTIREEHGLRVFENRVLKGSWRKLHAGEIHNLYSSPSIIEMEPKRIRWTRHVARMRRRLHRGYWLVSQKERDH